MLSTGRCMTVWKRCFWMARYPRMVDGDNVRLLRLIYSSMETVSVGSCSGSSGFSGSRFLANHSALMAAASLVQSLAVAAVTGMLSPPRRSWMNQLPDGSFLGAGTFMRCASFRIIHLFDCVIREKPPRPGRLFCLVDISIFPVENSTTSKNLAVPTQ